MNYTVLGICWRVRLGDRPATPAAAARRESADVDLAGHGGSDEGGAVFLEALDGSFDLRDQLIDLSGLSVEVLGDATLLVRWSEAGIARLAQTRS